MIEGRGWVSNILKEWPWKLVTPGFKGGKFRDEQYIRIWHASSERINNVNSTLFYRLQLFSLWSSDGIVPDWGAIFENRWSSGYGVGLTTRWSRVRFPATVASNGTGKPPSHPDQLSILPSAGNKYPPKCSDAQWLGSKGRYGSFHLWINMRVAGKTVWCLINMCHTWAS